MSKINKEELAIMSGEKNLRHSGRYSVPIISLQGTDNVFQRKFPDTSGKWETKDLDDKELEVVFLKIRRRLFQFKIDSSGKSTGEALFSNEHDSFTDKVTILETTIGGKTMKIDEGYYDEIREKYQGLKVHIQIYCLMGDEVIQLVVKGSSLSSLFKYLKEDIADDEYSYEYVTKLTKLENAGQLGKYYSIEFSKGKKSDLEIIGPKIKEVFTALNIAQPIRQEEQDENKPPVESYEQASQEQENKEEEEDDDIPVIE
uniref:Uncharacterized protein n=1 Tax=viral metagenome TaxID=1070528 RepID=A0A6M3L0Z5_9ZZZZ